MGARLSMTCDCLKRGEGDGDKPAHRLLPADVSDSPANEDERLKSVILGRIKHSGRQGVIVCAHPHDKEHTYKFEFSDGLMPTVDWVAGDNVALIGDPFTFTLRNSKTGAVNTLSGLSPESLFWTVYTQAENELGVRHGHLHLPLAEDVVYPPSLDDKIGALGLIEGAQIEYVVIEDFDRNLLRMDTATENGYSEHGDIQTHTVVGLIYGRRGTTDQVLLWGANDTNVASPKNMPNLHGASLSDDGCELLLRKPGGEIRRHAVSTLLAVVREAPRESLEQQFKNYFGEEKWPVYMAKVCKEMRGPIEPPTATKKTWGAKIQEAWRSRTESRSSKKDSARARSCPR